MNRKKCFIYCRRVCWLVVILLTIFLSQRLYFSLTAGFRISRIHSNFNYNPNWDVRPMTTDEEQITRAALDQKYYYLGRGCQSYAFVSEDGEYVIKFCKQHHLRLPWFLVDATLPLGLEEWRLNYLKRKHAKRDLIFYGFKLGYERVPEETGVLYSHINRTDSFLGALTIVDKIGFEHTVYLDDIVFLLQKRTHPIKPTIQGYMLHDDEAGAKRVIDEIFTVFRSRSEKGIVDKDNAMVNNLGWRHGKVYVIDLGSLDEDENIKEKKTYKKDIWNRSIHFRNWLDKEYPTLHSHFVNRVNKI